MSDSSGVIPAPPLVGATRYEPGRSLAPIDLDLAGTDGGPRGEEFLRAVGGDWIAGAMKYPETGDLARGIAGSIGVATNRVLVTAGADDALERAFRAVLAERRDALLTSPTFEMLPRYAALTGASIVTVSWPGDPFPRHDMLAAVTARTALIAIVTPNNPTGSIATVDDIEAIATAAPTALVVVDLAYTEFADVDLTGLLLQLPNVVITRTFSKAWGLPGVRVGWAAGGADVIEWMRRAGSPYTVAAPSLAMATSAFERGAELKARHVRFMRESRDRLTALCAELGLNPLPSQANFVCLNVPDGSWIRDALAAFGIGVRVFSGQGGDRVRITCPATDEAWTRLEHALRTLRAPEAILVDMDGVLVDVARSYDAAIMATCAGRGVAISREDIAALRARGNANDDWELTAELLARAGREAPLRTVITEFESLYQGTPVKPGLRELEQPLISRERLARFAARLPLGVVTGRPRRDAERFLDRAGVADLFRCAVCREDGPLKPDPFPVREALRRLGVSRAWMVGDTPDDVRAARAAGVLPVAVHPASAGPFADALDRAGAARRFLQLADVEALLP